MKLGKTSQTVIYVILEWTMIVLLFVDGLLAFLSNEFAKFFDLRVPCLLCTRIDHILINCDPTFYYNDSMCEVHKKDLSSLAYCHMHKKLSDIQNMCPSCLLSFATGKETDCDKYKSLVGILNQNIVDGFMDKSSKNDDGDVMDDNKNDVGSYCSCCGESLKCKVAKKKYTRTSSIIVPSPSPRTFGSKNDNDELPRIGIKEVESSSDTESENPEDEPSNVESQGWREIKTTASISPFLSNTKDISASVSRTPSFARRNKHLTTSFEAALLSPRWVNRVTSKPPVMEPSDTFANEADGDVLNRLKNQLNLDHNSLLALYKELDEERSAAAIAANNAMAMITRLQAEKAAVQMEALQYQRMMEEQAEYDEEALQLMRDMVLKRDEEVKALESELEMYKDKYGAIKRVSSNICEVDIDEDDCHDMKSQSLSDCGSLSADEQNNSEDPFGHPMQSIRGNKEDSSLDFEGERTLLLGLLTDLEKKMLEHEGEDEGTGSQNKVVLTREMSLMKERLKAIEAESGFLKHAAMTLQRGGEGTKVLAEIAQHLRDLRHTTSSPSDNTVA